jgi:hypothetical protein
MPSGDADRSVTRTGDAVSIAGAGREAWMLLASYLCPLSTLSSLNNGPNRRATGRTPVVCRREP